jgi:DNA replication protein DnaC
MAEKICSACQDTGWVLEESKGQSLAKRCSCFIAKQGRILIAKANIPKRYEGCTFANFEIHHETHKDALKISQKLVENYPCQEIGLLFIGPPGVGKTHLAVAILNELMSRKNAACVFYDFRDLIRDIQSTFTPDSVLTESDIMAPVFQSQVLVMDELGAKRSSSWVEETIFYLINHRYNQKKLTIFTSNFLDTSDEEDLRQTNWKKTETNKKGDDTLIDRVGYRLRSRIYEMCRIVEILGTDYRKEIRQDSYRFRF